VKLEVGAIAKRFEAENLKPLQFKQLELLGKNSGRFSVADCQRCCIASCLPDGFLRSRKDARLTHDRPRLERAGTNSTNCNGELGARSSNITLYIVWPFRPALWVAHTLQQLTILQARVRTRWENRESRIMVSQSGGQRARSFPVPPRGRAGEPSPQKHRRFTFRPASRRTGR